MEIVIQDEAARAIWQDKILALPTDTVWGLMCSARRPETLERLYQLKGRPEDKPFQVLCADVVVARGLAALSPGLERDFERLSAFWPGGLTLLCPARAEVPARLRPGGVVGLRVPDFAPVQALLSELGGYAACTSLNPSGAPAFTSLEQARAHPELYDALWNVGQSGGQASTVFSLLERRVLRPGALSEDQLLEALA